MKKIIKKYPILILLSFGSGVYGLEAAARLVLQNLRALIQVNGVVRVGSGMLQIIMQVKLMIEAARKDGITLTVVSSYRSEERQTNNFRNYFNNAVSAGRSREEAFAFTASQIAIPNTSEHNAGLAIDFNLIRDDVF